MNKYMEQVFNDNLIKTDQTIEVESLDMTEDEIKNIIVIQCNKGHLYKLNKESPIFDEEIKMQCPFCSKRQIVNKLQYSLFDNTEKLITLIETYPKIFGFLKYLRYYNFNTNKEIELTDLEILDNTLLIIEKTIDNPYITCDKKVKVLGDVLVFPEYLSIRDLIAKCFCIDGLEESIEHIYNEDCHKTCENINIDISKLEYNRYYHTLLKDSLSIISKKALIKYIDAEIEKEREKEQEEANKLIEEMDRLIEESKQLREDANIESKIETHNTADIFNNITVDDSKDFSFDDLEDFDVLN